MTDDLPFLCICDEEWCWCMKRVPTLDTPCAECAEGRHVMAPPTNDNHEASPNCWCQPRVSSEDPVTGERVYVHKATTA